MAAYKIYRLGDYEKPHGDDLGTQSIDHVWHGKPNTGMRMEDCDHDSKIQIHGKNCVEIATQIVASLNAADALLRAPATTEADRLDRNRVLAAMPLMGSMAVAGLYHTLGLDYGKAGFKEALDVASRRQLDRLVTKCQPYLER